MVRNGFCPSTVVTVSDYYIVPINLPIAPLVLAPNQFGNLLVDFV